MTAVMAERNTIAVVRSIYDDLDLPEGYRAEIIEGQIVVSPAPAGRHAGLVRKLRLALEPSLEDGLGCYDNTALVMRSGNTFIPDIAVWPTSLIDQSTAWKFAADECLLAVEVTSPDQEDRDYRKAKDYAESGVPVYLPVDLKQLKCVLHTEPAHEEYSTVHTVAFGDLLTLPAPFLSEIDTGAF